MHYITYLCLLLCLSLNSYAWNTRGHQLVAQIAYDHLTPEALRFCNQYTRPHGKYYSSEGLIQAATWLDSIRWKKIAHFNALHYIDIPFSRDKSRLPPIEEINVLWGVNQALKVLSSVRTSSEAKELSLRVLAHLIGDIHQPLHTITKVSRRLPQGDSGGNLFHLAKNSVGANLHQYWDNGGGILVGKNKRVSLKVKAWQLEKKWPCLANEQQKPEEWVAASHQLAITYVYNLKSHRKPDRAYQLMTQALTEKQLALAGCRLAHLLNEINSRPLVRQDSLPRNEQNKSIK